MNEATSPPSRRSVAAIPVPVPLTGAGKDSGVNANIMAYSVETTFSNNATQDRDRMDGA